MGEKDGSGLTVHQARCLTLLSKPNVIAHHFSSEDGAAGLALRNGIQGLRVHASACPCHLNFQGSRSDTLAFSLLVASQESGKAPTSRRRTSRHLGGSSRQPSAHHRSGMIFNMSRLDGVTREQPSSSSSKNQFDEVDLRQTN